MTFGVWERGEGRDFCERAEWREGEGCDLWFLGFGSGGRAVTFANGRSGGRERAVTCDFWGLGVGGGLRLVTFGVWEWGRGDGCDL